MNFELLHSLLDYAYSLVAQFQVHGSPALSADTVLHHGSPVLGTDTVPRSGVTAAFPNLAGATSPFSTAASAPAPHPTLAGGTVTVSGTSHLFPLPPRSGIETAATASGVVPSVVRTVTTLTTSM